jgi:protein TonB
VNPNAAPVEAPKEIKPEVPVDTSFERSVGVEGGIPGGVVGGVVGGLPEAPPPPPPPPPAQPVRVGGQIKAPTQIRKVNPVYPQIAQSARVQGVVILEATIGTDGKVKDVRVLRSIPLLDQAAIDAVRQWEYTPTLLNNVPVPVIMTVTVQFTLS